MYVVKIKSKYAKFESYSGVKLVDLPEQATLYTRESDARRRVDGTRKGFKLYAETKPHVIGKPLQIKQILTKDMAVYRVEFSSTEVEVK